MDLTELQSLLSLAEGRVKEQTKWNALTKKVPDYAPWAPNGYQRMLEAVSEARQLLDKDSKQLKANDVEAVTAALNRAVNTMRPGNLAEVEDLRPLTALLRRAGSPDDSSTEALRSAVSYGKMVVSYVTDGSGTKDMIAVAVDKLKKAIE